MLYEIFYSNIFELLYFFLTSASFLVVTASNPVHAVLYLVLVFCLSALLLLFVGVDFLGVVFVVLYVGAVAVLFLFCVMMLTSLSTSLLYFDRLVLDWLFIFLGLQFGFFFFNFNESSFFFFDEFFFFSRSTVSVIDLGYLLYTYYFFVFVLLGFVLFLAMVGSIMLTLNRRLGVRSQVVANQLERDNLIWVYTSAN